MWFRKQKPEIPEPIQREHIPCLYVVTYFRPDGLKRMHEVVATSPRSARDQVVAMEPESIHVVRTFREGFVE